ncbi:homeobox onecut [Brachionus plicatilis]|uniref:One cut domain family member n=1 Tax=Brachionus plicatilis TaxID=10195 RepID=A0A3M7RHP6_BRAPC|nr:homeobox onecut [Brachionus plicatilis]
MFRLMADFNNFSNQSVSSLHSANQLHNHHLTQSNTIPQFQPNHNLMNTQCQNYAYAANSYFDDPYNTKKTPAFMHPSQQIKNPNRNKKVKDLILDLRMQQHQQHHQQQQSTPPPQAQMQQMQYPQQQQQQQQQQCVAMEQQEQASATYAILQPPVAAAADMPKAEYMQQPEQLLDSVSGSYLLQSSTPEPAGDKSETELSVDCAAKSAQCVPSPTNSQMEEINTKELAHKISSELKRYSIPQAVFAQRVLCRSQGTLSDLLRNPKPWSKLKSGRETFRRMYKWLQEPESQRMNALRQAAAVKRKDEDDDEDEDADEEAVDDDDDDESEEEEESVKQSRMMQINQIIIDHQMQNQNQQIQQQPAAQPSQAGHHAKKPRLVFTDIQRRTLQAIFKETKRPSKEMQVTIAQQLGLEVATVSNFFMNARRRSMDKWKDQDDENSNCSIQK